MHENTKIICVIILAWCIIMTQCFNLNCPMEGWINFLASKYNSWDSVSSLQRSPGNIYQKIQVQNKLLCWSSQSSQCFVYSCNKWQYTVKQCEFDPVTPFLSIILANFMFWCTNIYFINATFMGMCSTSLCRNHVWGFLNKSCFLKGINADNRRSDALFIAFCVSRVCLIWIFSPLKITLVQIC